MDETNGMQNQGTLSAQESEKRKRERRTPSKYGNYYEVERAPEEAEEDEVNDEDDSDEDPSWVRLLVSCYDSISKNLHLINLNHIG
jgi:hypothetical protein